MLKKNYFCFMLSIGSPPSICQSNLSSSLHKGNSAFMYLYKAAKFLCNRNFPIAANEVFMLARRNKSILTSKSYYSIIKGLSIADGTFRAIRPLFCSFIKEYGIFEPKISRMLVHYICLSGDVNSALYFLKKMEENNVAFTIPVSALRSLMKNGKFLSAYELVIRAEDYVPVMDVVDYSMMVDGLCKGGHFVKALNLCDLAVNKGISLNIVTYNSVINGLCNRGCLVEAFRLFDSLERIKLVPSQITYSTLIHNLCKQGYLLDAKLLFERMVLKGYEVNMRIYNSFLNGYCKFGQLEDALEILKNVQVEGLDPDEFTISSIINGYCQKGDMEGALNFFLEHKQRGVSPDFLGFSYLIRGLYAKGRMEEARSILREMLQSQSAIELLKHVNTGVETESIESFLVVLCEQGTVKEAVIVLDEIVSMFFPVQKCIIPCESHEMQSFSRSEDSPRTISSHEQAALDFVSCDAMKVDRIVENSEDLGTRFDFDHFNSYYSQIASLCSSGEIAEANKLAKEMLACLGEKIS